AGRKFVLGEAEWREWMDDIPHLIPVAEPQRGAEVVCHNAEVIAMVPNAVWKEGRITPRHNELLVPVRGLPVHFDLKFVCPYHPFEGSAPVIDDRCHPNDAVRGGAPRGQEGVGVPRESLLGRTLQQWHRSSGLPILRTGRSHQ